jgi:hypothetical protein
MSFAIEKELYIIFYLQKLVANDIFSSSVLVSKVSIVMKQYDLVPLMKETSISWSFSQSMGH